MDRPIPWRWLDVNHLKWKDVGLRYTATMEALMFWIAWLISRHVTRKSQEENKSTMSQRIVLEYCDVAPAQPTGNREQNPVKNQGQRICDMALPIWCHSKPGYNYRYCGNLLHQSKAETNRGSKMASKNQLVQYGLTDYCSSGEQLANGDIMTWYPHRYLSNFQKHREVTKKGRWLVKPETQPRRSWILPQWLTQHVMLVVMDHDIHVCLRGPMGKDPEFGMRLSSRKGKW